MSYLLSSSSQDIIRKGDFEVPPGVVDFSKGLPMEMFNSLFISIQNNLGVVFPVIIQLLSIIFGIFALCLLLWLISK